MRVGATCVAVCGSIQLPMCIGCTTTIDGPPAPAHQLRKSPVARVWYADRRGEELPKTPTRALASCNDEPWYGLGIGRDELAYV